MSLRVSLDRSQPNTLPDQLRKMPLGQTARQDWKQTKRKLDPDTSGTAPEDLATLDSIVIPNDAKAGTIFRAFARAGAGTLGELTVLARHTTPTLTTHVAVAPSGNLVFLAADAYTDVDVEYLPERGDVVVLPELPVVANVLTLPANVSGNALVLIQADATTATATGRKIVLTPGGAPVAGQASLDIAGTTVTFAGADAVTGATVILLVDAAVDLDALLENDPDPNI